MEHDDRDTWQATRGRWIGMVRFKDEGRTWLNESLEVLRRRGDFAQLGLPDLLNHLVAAGRPVHVWYVHGHWLDVNSVQDLEDAGNFAAGSN